MPELAVRRLIHARGLRYLVDARPLVDLRRRADLVFRGARLAVFIDGCYWHGCPVHCRPSGANEAWWRAKIDRTRARDVETDAILRTNGWRVIRAWAHEPAAAVADRVEFVARGSSST